MNIGTFARLLTVVAVLAVFAAGAANAQDGVPYDFNQDYSPDLIWQNTQTGALVYLQSYASNNGQWNWVNGDGAVIPSPNNPVWVLDSCLDVNGDGYPDLLWRSTKTGAVYYWIMGLTDPPGGNNSEPVSMEAYASLGTLPLGFKVVTAPYLDSSIVNVPDLIWETNTGTNVAVYYWIMNYTAPTDNTPAGVYALNTPTSYAQLNTSGLSSQWHIVGSADINGDGVPDLFWQNSTTGQLVYWLMSYTAPTEGNPAGVYALSSYGVVTPAVGTPSWHVVSVDADGTTIGGTGETQYLFTILWQHSPDNSVIYWQMQYDSTLSPVVQLQYYDDLISDFGPLGVLPAWQIAGMS